MMLNKHTYPIVNTLYIDGSGISKIQVLGFENALSWTQMHGLKARVQSRAFSKPKTCILGTPYPSIYKVLPIG